MDGAQSTVPTKKSVPALKGGVRLEKQPAGENTDSQIDLFPWPLGSWSSGDVMHLRSHTSTLAHNPHFIFLLVFPYASSLCKRGTPNAQESESFQALV